MRIMSPFEGTLSSPSFLIHMIIKMSITPTSLPFHTSGSFCSILTFHWVSLQTHIGYQHKFNQLCSLPSLHWLSSLSICFHSNYSVPHCTWLFKPRCFILDTKEAFLKGNIVALGHDTCQKVVMVGIIEVGRHLSYMRFRKQVNSHGLCTDHSAGCSIEFASISPSFPGTHSHGNFPMLLSILIHLWEAR